MSQAVANSVLQGVTLPEAGTWTIDKSHSTAAFNVRHLMVSKVRGRFARLDGTITINEIPELSKADVTIDASSIDTNDVKRDEHLRSPDFLDVAQFPALQFRSSQLEVTSRDSFKLHGELTIRDTTRPVTLNVTYEGVVTDPWGNTKTGFSATTEIDREEFGITWNQALETGGVLVGKKVQIQLDIEAAKA